MKKINEYLNEWIRTKSGTSCNVNTPLENPAIRRDADLWNALVVSWAGLSCL